MNTMINNNNNKIMLTRLPAIITATALSLWVVFTLWATNLVMNNNTHIYAENGLLENIQAGILAITFVVYLVNSAVEKNSCRLILLSCSLLCYAFLLRELDVEKFDIPSVLQMLGSGIGRNLTIAIAFFALFFYAARYFSFYKAEVVNFLRTRPGSLLIMAGVFLVIGSVFEDIYAITHHVFIEESLELFAYGLIMLSSLSVNSYINSITISQAGVRRA
jgi:hypothetical protein